MHALWVFFIIILEKSEGVEIGRGEAAGQAYFTGLKERCVGPKRFLLNVTLSHPLQQLDEFETKRYNYWKPSIC